VLGLYGAYLQGKMRDPSSKIDRQAYLQLFLDVAIRSSDFETRQVAYGVIAWLYPKQYCMSPLHDRRPSLLMRAAVTSFHEQLGSKGVPLLQALSRDVSTINAETPYLNSLTTTHAVWTLLLHLSANGI
jgi:hypothetical protein